MNIAVMDPKKIAYQELHPWKYRTTQDHNTNIDIHPPILIEVKNRDKDVMTRLAPNGDFFIRHDYAWDGASGPTYDSPDTQRASLYHDVGYQFMRKGLLPKGEYKDKFDRLLEKTMVEDGNALADAEAKKGGFWDKAKAKWIRSTIGARAGAWYQAVKNFAGKACDPGPEPIDEEIIAP
jgi:hypothetical protein